jgi:hypothetical protein
VFSGLHVYLRLRCRIKSELGEVRIIRDLAFRLERANQRKPNLLSSQIYEWGTREGSGVFARLMIRAITAAISSMIAVPATKTVTKAMSKAVLA